MGHAKVIVVGSLNWDVNLEVATLPAQGETVVAREARSMPGGKGLNQAVAAARQGASVELVGKVGADRAGRIMRESAKTSGVGIRGIRVCRSSASGGAVVVVDRRGQNIIVVHEGANAQVSVDDVRRVDITSSDVVVAQWELSARVITAALMRARNTRARTIVNPSPWRTGDSYHRTLRLADTLVVNETELGALVNGRNGLPIANRLALAQQREGQVVVATMGRAGLAALTATGVIRIDGLKVRVVDTTGAGDCFVGALAACMVKGEAWSVALEWANVAAALSVSRRGAGSAPTRQMVAGAMKRLARKGA